MAELKFKTERLNDIIKVNIKGSNDPDWEQWVLLTSDRHWDNPKSNRDLQKKHLDKAKERNAMVIDLGDLFCLMQGRYDPRGSKSSVREEHNVDHYLDAVIEDAIEYFSPYAENLVMVGVGNHEASVSRRCETDITRRFVEGLRGTCSNATVLAGGITGFIKLIFTIGSRRHNYLVDYHHGYGGGGPVTRNVIQSNRRAVYSNADIVCQGHVHEAWQMPITKRTVTQSGYITHKTQWHLQVPSYKHHYGKGKVNWENLKGFPPKPVGCVWLRFFRDDYTDPETRRRVKGVNFDRHIDIIEYGA
tara:strand:+ start:4848 stop:5756 length:909 start_codon:yes stop_codon:yes gene_type:complete